MIVITFRNQALKDLWTGGPKGYGGLAGQISDGMWENSWGRTGGYRDYSRAKLQLGPVTKVEGEGMYAAPRSFGFNRLIKYVGDKYLVILQRHYPNADMNTVKAAINEIQAAFSKWDKRGY